MILRRKNETHRITRFVSRLNEQIKERVELQPHWNFSDVCKVAKRIENQVQSKKVRSIFKNFDFKKDKEAVGTSSGKPKVEAKKPKVNTPFKVPLLTDDKKKRFKCQGFGHMQRICPSARVITVREAQEIQEAYDNENFEEEEDDLIQGFEEEVKEGAVAEEDLQCQSLVNPHHWKRTNETRSS